MHTKDYYTYYAFIPNGVLGGGGRAAGRGGGMGGGVWVGLGFCWFFVVFWVVVLFDIFVT